MSRDVFWIAIGLFLLNLGALIGWALAYRPSLVLTNGHDERAGRAPGDVAGAIVRRATSWLGPAARLIGDTADATLRRMRQIGANLATRRRLPRSSGARVARADNSPAAVPPVDLDGDALDLIEQLEASTPAAHAKPAPDAALERWLSELDAGDRAETTTHHDDPDQWWRAWAETHGSKADGHDGNNVPRAAESGRSRRQAKPRRARTTA